MPDNHKATDPQSEPIITWITGSAFGLKLILNVEQYEYMKGPNNDAGVKVRVHE